MINTDDSATFCVLSVGPMDEHQIALAEIFWRTGGAPLPSWRLECCVDVETALPELRKGIVPIVLCDGDAEPSLWRQLLDHLRRLPNPPFLIVTSRLADDRLWSEALNLGAYDVLTKPFEGAEVSRVLSMAWLRWAALRKIQTTEPVPAVELQPA
jgi:DNA-binding response OmpR family regulator